ncbi:hypothetical protein THOM_2326 [Trachipleistophora hominis]|uniref:Uncharacterized protein n=1 Tax=Trachipleistophora hominis TaxID=72359 RepID=L7JTL2_TRAHO|nr:hypothetical protein THOM_2326 [Trachipleistophora hominis]
MCACNNTNDSIKYFVVEICISNTPTSIDEQQNCIYDCSSSNYTGSTTVKTSKALYNNEQYTHRYP